MRSAATRTVRRIIPRRARSAAVLRVMKGVWTIEGQSARLGFAGRLFHPVSLGIAQSALQHPHYGTPFLLRILLLRFPGLSILHLKLTLLGLFHPPLCRTYSLLPLWAMD